MKVFSLAREEQIFIVKEDSEGTLKYPSASNGVLAVGVSTIAQDVEMIDDAQLRGSRSKLQPIKGRTHPGSWSFTTYIKPSGALGEAPEADVLFECLMGKKTVTPATKVDYLLDSTINLPSFSLWVRKGHTIFAMAGCTVNQADFEIGGAAIAQVAWSGQFMMWYMGGQSKIATTCANGASTVVVDKAERFSSSMMKIKIGDDDNDGAGYTITEVDYATNTITFTPTLAGAGEAAGLWVQGFWPATLTEKGKPVHGKLGLATISTVPTKIMSGKITVVNNIKYYEDEKNGQLYPTTYEAIGFRDVSGSLTLLFYKGAAGYFYRAANQDNDALVLPAGDVAGRIFEFSAPKIEYKTPSISGDPEVMCELPFIAVGTAVGDDEAKITFR